MTTVATVEIPLSQSDVDWLTAARDTLAPTWTNQQVLDWLATHGRHMLAQEITTMLIRHQMTTNRAAEQAIRDGAMSAPPAEFGGTE